MRNAQPCERKSAEVCLSICSIKVTANCGWTLSHSYLLSPLSSVSERSKRKIFQKAIGVCVTCGLNIMSYLHSFSYIRLYSPFFMRKYLALCMARAHTVKGLKCPLSPNPLQHGTQICRCARPVSKRGVSKQSVKTFLMTSEAEHSTAGPHAIGRHLV